MKSLTEHNHSTATIILGYLKNHIPKFSPYYYVVEDLEKAIDSALVDCNIDEIEKLLKN